MTPAGGNKFTGTIPATTFGKQVQYYYVCTDNNGLTAIVSERRRSSNGSDPVVVLHLSAGREDAGPDL